jgi:hypothetical protein
MWHKAAVVVVGCSVATSLTVGGAAASTEPPASTEPETAVDDDQAAAEGALLTLADFPDGWTETPAEDLTDLAVESRRRIAECAGGEGDSLLDLGGALAESGNFRGPDDEVVEESVAIVDLAVAEDLMARFSAPGVDDCFADAMQDSVEALVATPPDPEQAFPEDAVVGKVTASPLEVAPGGDELTAYRIVVPIATQGLTIDIVLDAVLIRSGRSVAGLSFQSVLSPFPTEEIDRYVALAVERLPSRVS